MRVPIVAGNWKMHKTSDDAEDLARGIVYAVKRYRKRRTSWFVPPLRFSRAYAEG